MTSALNEKKKSAIKLLQTISMANGWEPLEVAYSGGKDSDVILALTKMAGIPYRAIYKNTTIDPPGTIKHVQEMGVEILQPKKTFFQLIEENGFPSRWVRHCCRYLKEYKVMDRVVIGIRREESPKRASRYVEPTVCRVYSKTEKVEQILPILDWTLADVQMFIETYQIKLAPHYYREDGTIDYTRRLGCMGCPLANYKNRIEVFKQHPGMVKRWCKAAHKYMETHPNAKVCQLFSDEYEYFQATLFYDMIHKATLNKESLFKTDYKKALEDYFNITL